jgi:hypothetical protein
MSMLLVANRRSRQTYCLQIQARAGRCHQTVSLDVNLSSYDTFAEIYHRTGSISPSFHSISEVT